MQRQRSLSKLSKNNLTTIKDKITKAFISSNSIANINQSIPNKNIIVFKKEEVKRSSSLKSLKGASRALRETEQENVYIPFAYAINKNMIALHKKVDDQSHASSRKKISPAYLSKEKKSIELKMTIKNEFKGELIQGYSWYNSKQSELITNTKKSKEETLRYFSMKTENQGKVQEKQTSIIAAIENDMLYINTKFPDIYMMKCTNKVENNLDFTFKKDSQEKGIYLKDDNLQFIIIFNCSKYFIKQNKQIAQIFKEMYSYLKDGLDCFDILCKMIGKKINAIHQSSKHQTYKYAVNYTFVLLLALKKQVKIDMQNEVLRIKKQMKDY